MLTIQLTRPASFSPELITAVTLGSVAALVAAAFVAAFFIKRSQCYQEKKKEVKLWNGVQYEQLVKEQQVIQGAPEKVRYEE